jgi:6-pyruvoyltetrahydropterin/6-carboxytetrahydropterin synthase
MRPAFQISKTFDFSAAHQLHGLSPDHPCSRMHGHNYTVKIEIGADQVDNTGFVIDYRKLGSFKEYLDETFDHRILNEVLYREDDEAINPTAENLAKFFYYVVRDGEIGEILNTKPGDHWITVGVSETPKTWATYSE